MVFVYVIKNCILYSQIVIQCFGMEFIWWWRHQMDTFSALLALCAGNSPVPGEFPSQRSVTRSFDVFFDLRLNKRLSKQSWGAHYDVIVVIKGIFYYHDLSDTTSIVYDITKYLTWKYISA